jgi:hypothetical protein
VVAPVFTDEELESLRRFPEIGREELRTERDVPRHYLAQWPEGCVRKIRVHIAVSVGGRFCFSPITALQPVVDCQTHDPLRYLAFGTRATVAVAYAAGLHRCWVKAAALRAAAARRTRAGRAALGGRPASARRAGYGEHVFACTAAST